MAPRGRSFVAETRKARGSSGIRWRRWAWENGLSIAMAALFFASLGGQIATGIVEYNDDRLQHGMAAVSLENSLSIALLSLFAFSFAMHGLGGLALYNEDRARHDEGPISFVHYLVSSRFWFESFQNWQSEFMSVGVLIVLSTYLRQQGSPQSKRTSAPHDETGE